MRFLSSLTPLLCAFTSLSAAPVITEFCASNQTGLEDEDGKHSDWIEIHNPDATPADLTGWYLTDNAGAKTKWQFPSTTLAPNAYLVVFASSNNRRIPGSPLHTNFALGAGGEYLGLIKPDGVTVISEYAPSFPAQFGDISYGIPSNLSTTSLITSTATCQWKVPSSASDPGSTWKDISFNTTGWTTATMGIGYDRNTSGVNYLPLIGTNGNTDSAMTSAGNPSCYVRIPFTVPSGTTVTGLKLRMKYDDGYAVWLNGQPLLANSVELKRNAPATLNWNSGATAKHDDPVAVVFEEVNVSENIPNLQEGANVLSIQSLNESTSSGDHLLNLELQADTTVSGPAMAPGYFATATPGSRNSGPSGLVIPQPVTFSRPSGTSAATFNLTLGGALAGQVIRYTLDGTVPTASSTQYSAPFAISSSRLVRARIFDTATGAVGFTYSAQYELLATDLSSYGSTAAVFQSSLPIVVLNNNGKGELGNDNVEKPTRIQIFDRAASGYSSLAGAPTQTLTAGVKLRGRSSASFPKKSYGIEVQNESGDGMDASILGMPAGEDWALIGGWSFDRAFMRNAFIYELSRQAGRWAPRTRLVEVYFNQDGDSLEYTDYRGVYVLCETIRNAPDRVDIAKLETADTTEPNISGGYIFKVDPAEADEFSWYTTRGLPNNDGCKLVIHRPKLASLDTSQSAYLQNYFQQFENAVASEAAANFTTRNYRNYIDSAAWADHNLFSTFTKNVDGLRLSAYFHKDRNEKIAAGPVWDFDRSVNNTDTGDNRDADPTGWRGTGDATYYFNYSWWQWLFQDVEFRQVYVDRWHAMRKGPLATENVNAVLDGYLAEFKPADAENPAMRDYRKWYGSLTSNDIIFETNAMKTWLSARAAWIDGQLAGLPTISRASGPVAAGLATTITVPAGTTVYYTTDGTDPRAVGGGIRPGVPSLTSSGQITIPASMRLIARAYRTGSYATPATNWSGVAEATYLVDETYATAATLEVSAVNYHPLEPTAAETTAIPGVTDSDFEWIELKNISAAPVNLEGISFVKDAPVSSFSLPAYSLAPGQRAVIAKNLAAFQLRYGATAASKVAATWSGYRSLDNGGAEITILDRSGATLADLEFDDEGDWPTRADGTGSSLVYIGGGYNNPLSWKSSTAVHGTPGAGDSTRGSAVINEIVASRTSAPDAIELYNSGGSNVDISGWYLSNSVDAATETSYRQFRIPNGTQLAPGGYAVFNASDFDPTPAELDTDIVLDGARGGTTWLISADPTSGKLLNFEQKEDYSPTLVNVSQGRSPNGTGGIVPLGSVTLAAANSAPRIGSVQVSEIHYHPSGATPEFVEISNTGTGPEPLGGWTLRGDVDFDFPVGFTLAPAEAIVVVSFDPALSPSLASSFRSQYGVAAGVRLVGPWSSGDTLSNTAGTARLRRRVPPPAQDSGHVGLMIEDEVNYLSTAPWPTGASGTGSSIRRLGIFRQANDPTAWVSQIPNPGGGVGGYLAWKIENFTTPADGEASLDADSDGLTNLVEYLLGTNPNTPNNLAGTVQDNAGSPRFVLDYTLRLDRDDATLTAQQTGDLTTWSPATNDAPVSSNGITEQRRAWLPVEDKGFLRLRAMGK
ncbi:lamin tail domain-containing protein [Luteolibacter yonseiensis]|uniref:Lamin tail domain-containing protein n=1 Tax=Luteolibacter yonseiensis TaxID=1144680 RepID=A0A934R6Q2_9BACT|nr:lamin tail domain-containing protein [Luteolibacter yonseiensis]MBK1816435.1 lamin tail domain-containing protein [Luteolibacter yonseiensis]